MEFEVKGETDALSSHSLNEGLYTEWYIEEKQKRNKRNSREARYRRKEHHGSRVQMTPRAVHELDKRKLSADHPTDH